MRMVSRRAPFVCLSLLVTGSLSTLSGCGMMSGSVNNEMGKAYYKSGNYTMARDEFQRAVINNPSNADYTHNLATAYKKQGKVDEAERIYQHAITANPEHQPSYHSLALLLKEQGREGEAHALMQTWMDTQPYNAEPYIELAWLKRESGQLAEAEQLLHQALKIRPNNTIATAHLGQIYEDTGQSDRALAMYQRSSFARWDQPQVKSRMAALMRNNPRVAQTASASAVYAPAPWQATNSGYAPQTAMNYPLPTYAQYGPTPATVVQQPAPIPSADPAHAPPVIGTTIPHTRAF